MAPWIIVVLVFACILTFVAIISSFKFSIIISYIENLSVQLKWLWIKKNLLPADKKESPKKKSEKEKKESSKEKGANPLVEFSKNQGFDGVITLITDTAKIVGKLITGIGKHIKIKDLLIDIKISKEDAASTAIEYGKICAEVFPALGFIASYYKIKNYSVNIQPDFNNSNKSVAKFNVEFNIRSFFLINSILAAAFRAVFKILFKFLNFNKNETEERKEEKT